MIWDVYLAWIPVRWREEKCVVHLSATVDGIVSSWGKLYLLLLCAFLPISFLLVTRVGNGARS